jgi:hypothetical protein
METSCCDLIEEMFLHFPEEIKENQQKHALG